MHMGMVAHTFDATVKRSSTEVALPGKKE